MSFIVFANPNFHSQPPQPNKTTHTNSLSKQSCNSSPIPHTKYISKKSKLTIISKELKLWTTYPKKKKDPPSP